MIKAIIVDLDGTLAEVEHRIIDGKCDHTFIHEDEVNQAMRVIIGRMISDHRIVICTARSEEYKIATISWLQSNGIPYDKLIMKKLGDKRRDYLVKYDLWRNEIRDKYDITCVFDDNTAVVNMWRDIGLTCLQIRNTNY